MVEGWYWKITQRVCQAVIVVACVSTCQPTFYETIFSLRLLDSPRSLQLVPLTQFTVEMKAKLQKTTQMLTYSHIYKGLALEKEWNGELNTPTLGGNQHGC